MVSIFIGFLATVRPLRAGETRRSTGHLSRETPASSLRDELSNETNGESERGTLAAP
jgi:hypothetical protein